MDMANWITTRLFLIFVALPLFDLNFPVITKIGWKAERKNAGKLPAIIPMDNARINKEIIVVMFLIGWNESIK